jgi:hypothetical protein
MNYRCLALGCLASACGQVAQQPPGPDAASDAPVDAVPPAPYKGTQAETSPAMFGGTPYCNYTITLKQIEIDLSMLPSKQASSGRVQALNVEGTDASCPNGVIPPTIANYTLSASAPSSGGTTLTFQGAPDNQPQASLVANLTPTGTQYTAVLTFHRTDQIPQLNWTVQTTIVVSPQ